MIKKISVFIFGFFLFALFISSVSALGASISTCGNGFLEAGEQCDAGQLVYASSSHYPQVYCSPATCTCASGVIEEKHFAFNESVCAQITDCTPSLGADGSCSEEDSWFDTTHPHCGCPNEPECRCDDGNSYWFQFDSEKCNSCRAYISPPQQAVIGAGWTWGSNWVESGYESSTCYCDSNYWIPGTIDHDHSPECSYLNMKCNWIGSSMEWTWGSTLLSDCIPNDANGTICSTTGQPICSYPSLGNITNTCCASNQYCDTFGGGCVNITPITSPPAVPSVSVSIEVGAGNSEKRNIICKASATPKKAGDYTFTFSVGSTTSSQIIKTVVDVPPCPDVFNPTPVSAEYEFPDILTKDSGALKCHVDYIFLLESNSVDSSNLNDLDKDGSVSKNQFPSLKPWSAYDVDDWVFNDTKYGDSTEDYPCLSSGSAEYKIIVNETREKMKNCTRDNNNDGMGDFAACSYCRNPHAFEDADDIDNNGFGVCQANVSQPCRIDGDSYPGDGADDPTFETVYDSSGVEVGTMGCVLTKNEFNVDDHFCQMVDDVPGMQNYQRAVKWIDVVEDLGSIERHPTIPSNSQSTDSCSDGKHYLSDIGHLLSSFAFIPGGASTTGGPFPKTVSDFYDKYGGLKTTGNAFVGHILYEALVLVEPGNLKVCLDHKVPMDVGELNTPEVGLPSDESKAKQRGTIGTIFPDQFIDSFRGELNFNKFWSNYKDQIKKKDADGNFIVKWQMAFVSKDKCNDGVDNDGVEDLSYAAPYGNYLSVQGTNVDTSSFNSDTGSYKLVSSGSKVLAARLIDVDDPQCKFEGDQSVAVDYPHYTSSDYKINPITSKPYCLDEDGDGFCGAKMELIGSVGSGSGSFSGSYVPNSEDKEYVTSKQFPDCDDNSGDDGFQYLQTTGSGIKPVIALDVMGWKGSAKGASLGSWNVHPFAPVTSYNCFFGFDVNCNMDMAEGYNTVSLINGKTPFDDNLNTGKEYQYSHVQWYNPFGSQDSAPVDLQCFYYDPVDAITDKFVIGTAFSMTKVVIVGLTTAVDPAFGFVFFGLSVKDNGNLWYRTIFNNKNGAQDYVVATADTALLYFGAKGLASSVLPTNKLIIPSSSSSIFFSSSSKESVDKILTTFTKLSKDSVNGKKSVFGLYGYF